MAISAIRNERATPPWLEIYRLRNPETPEPQDVMGVDRITMSGDAQPCSRAHYAVQQVAKPGHWPKLDGLRV